MSNLDIYQTPLSSRYSSKEMKNIFSPRTRASTWRQLWIWLAESQKELGLNISDEAIAQMKAAQVVTDAEFVEEAEVEKRTRHDIMAHIEVFGKAAPAAAGIIHWGATSCYCTDNADLIFQRDALDLILPKLAVVIHRLSQFALRFKDVPTLGFTHFQPAQLITVGRRAAQWVQDLLMDLRDIERVRGDLCFRGAQGTTGTQASFMEIFQGDGAKIDRLNELLCEKAGFARCYPISTQTYSRKVDLAIANAVCSFGDTVQRITSDIRHLASFKELEEPFESTQVGSSAMAYKRNPMRSERIAGLGRYLSNLRTDAAATYSAQWFERTLDDSAIRRITLPEMFLSADAILITLDNVSNGLIAYPAVIGARIKHELPLMATENVIMKLVAAGKSRQEAHEQVRILSHQATSAMKLEGRENDLVSRIKQTPFFEPVWGEIDDMMDPRKFIGRCPEQVQRYCGLNSEVHAALSPYASHIKSSMVADLVV